MSIEAAVTTSLPRSPKAVRNALWFAALAGILVILLHESLFMGKGLAPALSWPPWNQSTQAPNWLLMDQFCFFLPTQEFDHQQNDLPLWNPNLCCGAPNLGSIQGALLNPIRWLFSGMAPFSASGPIAFLKLCLAGWFTMLYVRLLGVKNSAALLGGIIFSLSGFMIVWLGHPQVGSAIWLPLLLYFLEKEFKNKPETGPAKPNLRGWVGFAIAYSLMILAGHPPTAIHVSIVLFCYFLFRAGTCTRRQMLLPTCLLAGSVAAGLLLAAPQILPYLEYYRQSSSDLTSASLHRWSSHLSCRSLIHFLLPNLMGNPVLGFEDLPNLLNWNEMENFSERTGYVGILPLFLAAWAVAFRRCKFALFFAGLAGVSLLVILGAPPFPFFMRITPILRDINEDRLLLVVGFSFAVLAALGWDQFYQKTTRRAALATAAGFCSVVIAIVLCLGFVTSSKLHALDMAHWAFIQRQLVILGIGLAVVLFLSLWPPLGAQSAPVVVCLGWTAFDLLYFGIGFNTSISRDLYYPRTPAIEWLQKDKSVFRIFGAGQILVPDTAEVFGLQDARGLDYMNVQRYEELITGHAGNFLFYQNPATFPQTFPLLNVKYFLSDRQIPLNPSVFELVYSKEIQIYRFKECIDRALILHDYEVESNPAHVLTQVSAAGFDPRQRLWLEEKPESARGNMTDQTNGTNIIDAATIRSYEPNDVTVDASLSRPGYLLLLDTYFPGWRATVNGEPARIYRGDYNFRAVSLSTGKSIVRFSYHPQSLQTGLYLCGLGILILSLAWFLPPKMQVRVPPRSTTHCGVSSKAPLWALLRK